MVLTIVRRFEGTTAPREPEEVWRVCVGREEGEGQEQDAVPASVLAPELQAAQLYPLEEFRLHVQRIMAALSAPRPPSAEWTALPLRVSHALGELEEPVAVRSRQAAIMAVSECLLFAREALTDASSLWVRLE